MIRRSTAVVVVVFLLALGALLFLRQNPSLLQSATPTPQATPFSKLLTEWKEADISQAVLQRSVGGTTTLTRNPDGSWTNAAAGTVAPGKVEQLLSELLATNILVQMSADTKLEDLKLVTPGQIIVLRDNTGRQTTIKVGGMTPTESGYYVMMDEDTPVVVSKYAIEAVLKLFDEALPEATPTPTS